MINLITRYLWDVNNLFDLIEENHNKFTNDYSNTFNEFRNNLNNNNNDDYLNNDFLI